ncbi:sex hormone-binding globulin [Aplochiton taeniatus]
MQTRANLSELRSIKSTFEFRTLDPEGAVFYGDTKDGEDWFVLSLRDGFPEMQIGKADILVSALGGPKLNDGKWHLLGLSSLGKFVVLEVDGSNALVVGLESKKTQEDLEGQIRLALGGILVNEAKLVNPFRPDLDACIRKGSWLNLNTPWETNLAVDTSSCYLDIKPGSYFPGSGLASFNTSAFPIETEESGVKIEILGEFAKMNGTILSIGSPSGEGPWLTVEVNNNTENVILTWGKPLSTAALSCKRLVLTLFKNTLKFVLDERESVLSSPESMPDLLTSWRKGVTLVFGGRQVGGEYLQGCLEKIQIHGKNVDLDTAVVKDTSVSSFSCPA